MKFVVSFLFFILDRLISVIYRLIYRGDRHYTRAESLYELIC
ncbi:MAG: hypothetical protein QNJ54_00365 [Prochloraceae cyanobacterium]|nr:hypothetical protein [Prochloraceae cyanobacterium]